MGVDQPSKDDMPTDGDDINNADVVGDNSVVVTLSPAWSESTTDHDVYGDNKDDTNDDDPTTTLTTNAEDYHMTSTVVNNISPSTSSGESTDDDDEDIIMMTPSKSDLEYGIILPPSCSSNNDGVNTDITRSPSPPRVVSPSPSSVNFEENTVPATSSPLDTMSPSYKNCEAPVAATATAAAATTTTTAAQNCQLSSLPIDAQHCIASFLTPMEWSQYGQTCSAASMVGREIFRRVRMHGFRCATEVITAWVRALCCSIYVLLRGRLPGR